MISILYDIPFYTIFILILIISAGFFIELFPCKLRRVLSSNIYLKHFFCFLTMIFFVVLALPIDNKKLHIIIYKSFILYICFIAVIKTDYNFFIITMILLAILYLLTLKKNEIQYSYDNEKDIIKKKNYDDTLNNITYITNILCIIVIIVIIIGFLIYMGEKKLEYKNKFSYTVFLLGKTKCNNIDKHILMMESLKHAFI